MFARVLLGCVVVCTLAFASLADEPKEKETKLKPTAIFRGSHSEIREVTFDVVTNAKDWNALWSKHRGEVRDPLFTESSQSLEIDFDTHYVVALFVGNEMYCQLTTKQRGDTIVIGFSHEVVSTEGRLPDRTDHEKAKANAAAEYIFVLLPKPLKTVVIEENREVRRNQQPRWEPRAKFPAPKDKK